MRQKKEAIDFGDSLSNIRSFRSNSLDFFFSFKANIWFLCVFLTYLFISVAVLGLSCSTQDLFLLLHTLVAACKFVVTACGI